MELGSREFWEKNMPGDYGESDCVLCSPDKTPVLWKGKYFYICRNKYPYLGLKDHLMAVPYRHVTLSSELSKEEFSGLKEVEEFMKNYYGDKHYFSFIRQTNGGKSLNHIHYHFISGVLYSTAIEDMLKKQGF